MPPLSSPNTQYPHPQTYVYTMPHPTPRTPPNTQYPHPRTYTLTSSHPSPQTPPHPPSVQISASLTSICHCPLTPTTLHISPTTTPTQTLKPAQPHFQTTSTNICPRPSVLLLHWAPLYHHHNNTRSTRSTSTNSTTTNNNNNHTLCHSNNIQSSTNHTL